MNTQHNQSQNRFVEGYAPGMAGGMVNQTMCAFPQPPPKSCYCHPAPFSSFDGRSNFRLIDAYGSSRPCSM
jgi:hypothetical protein